VSDKATEWAVGSRRLVGFPTAMRSSNWPRRKCERLASRWCVDTSPGISGGAAEDGDGLMVELENVSATTKASKRWGWSRCPVATRYK